MYFGQVTYIQKVMHKSPPCIRTGGLKNWEAQSGRQNISSYKIFAAWFFNTLLTTFTQVSLPNIFPMKFDLGVGVEKLSRDAKWAANFFARALSGLRNIFHKMLFSSAAPPVINNDRSLNQEILFQSYVIVLPNMSATNQVIWSGLNFLPCKHTIHSHTDTQTVIISNHSIHNPHKI